MVASSLLPSMGILILPAVEYISDVLIPHTCVEKHRLGMTFGVNNSSESEKVQCGFLL
jgi:hypothetical protein